jgi:hypothetical protein
VLIGEDERGILLFFLSLIHLGLELTCTSFQSTNVGSLESLDSDR